MAGHLLRAGMPVTVWNRTPGKCEPLRHQGAEVATSPQLLAERSEVILTCVSRTEDVWECLEQTIPHASPGTLFVDHSTIAPSAAREMQAALAQKGLGFVDAPVTGGSAGAQAGQLTIFCGGLEEPVARAMEVVQPYAKRAERVGGPGTGQMMKLANQVAVAGSLLGLCEALAFAQKAGLDLAQTRDLLAGGAAGSWALDHYGPKILARDWSPGFSVKNQRKDLAYCVEAAQELDAALPGTLLVDLLLDQLTEEGRGEEATAALFDVLMESGAQA